MSSASPTSSLPSGPTSPKPEIRTNRATCRGRGSPTRKVCRNTCLKTYQRYRRSRTRNSAPITIATFGTASSSTNPNRWWGLCTTIQGTEHKRHKRHKKEFKLEVLLFFLCLLCSCLVLLVLRSRFVVQSPKMPVDQLVLKWNTIEFQKSRACQRKTNMVPPLPSSSLSEGRGFVPRPAFR